jgi:ATP-dependent RNA circularization protein (DNA/RNA ligase family)
MKAQKPLGGKAYGSIGHLPNSRLGPGDHSVHAGQARICTEKARDKHDTIIVQEKLDGSCTSVAMINGEILALVRAGYLAETSPFKQHHVFSKWVKRNEEQFRSVLCEGERLVGEWLMVAHGTKYNIANWAEPWGVFDLMIGHSRYTLYELQNRIGGIFHMPSVLHIGSPISVEEAMKIHETTHWPCEETEGIVYRVERKNKVDFLAKWVKPTKIDGKYLECVTGKKESVWNWYPAWIKNENIEV